MDHTNSNPNGPNGRSYYQMDPQDTGDQLSSHPSHELHNAAYPDSDYQPGIGYIPPPPGASSIAHTDVVGQDSKPYPPPEPSLELPSNSIHEVTYPDSDYRPGGGYSSGAVSSAQLAASPDSHYTRGEKGSLLPGVSTAPASDIIDNAAYPESNYRPGTDYSAPSPGPSQSRPIACPKHLESITSTPSPWTRNGSEAGPSGGTLTQGTGSELPPPPYQPGSESSTQPPNPQIQPPSPSYSRGEDPYVGYQSSGTSSPTRRRPGDPIPMTAFPVYQNVIGHVANNSSDSSALERTYKQYDPEQAELDDRSRRANRRKWLMGTLATTVIIAGIVGVVVALIRNNVFGDDDDDD